MEATDLDKSLWFLEEELSSIRERFENGDMRAFGSEQEKILKKFDAIRQSQAQIAMTQVSLLGEMMERMNKDKEEDWMQIPDISSYLQEKEKPTDDLLHALDDTCKAIEEIHRDLDTTSKR